MKEQLLEDKLTLHVKVEDESQVFSKFSYTEDNLNEELSSFLFEKAEHAFPLPVKENFTVEVHTTNPHLRLPEITRCIHHHFHNRYDAEKRKLRDNFRFATVLFLLGMLALVLRYFAVTYVNNFFLSEILNITSWVFVWGAVEVIVLKRHNIRRRCLVARRLAFAKVKINPNTKLDIPIYI